jgi:hypothetical protein
LIALAALMLCTSVNFTPGAVLKENYEGRNDGLSAVTAAIKGGAALVHGVQMMNKYNKLSM